MSNLSFNFKKIITAKSAGTYFLLGAFVLLIATYGIYQLQQLFSPNTGTSGDTNTVRIQLKASDRDSAGARLPNGLQPPAGGTPHYDYDWSTNGPTALPNGGLFRIQGEVYYKDKQI